jgi:hypothetical protein
MNIETFMLLSVSEALEFSFGDFLNFVSGQYWRTQTSLAMIFLSKILYRINPGV